MQQSRPPLLIISSSTLIIFIFFIILDHNNIDCARHCNAIAGMSCLCSSSLDCKVSEPLTSLQLKTTSTFKSIRLTFQAKALVIPSNFFTPISKLLDFDSIRRSNGAKNNMDQTNILTSNEQNNNNNQLLVHITFRRFDLLALDNFAFANVFGTNQAEWLLNRTKLSIDFYSEKTVTAYPETFSDLEVGHLELYGAFFTAPSAINTLSSQLGVPTNSDSSTVTMENLFNHSRITHTLRLEGIMLESSPRAERFDGKIGRLLVSKQVTHISANEYPYYGVTDFYTIIAHNAKNIDSLSFTNYTNLKGLMIHSGQLHLTGGALSGFRYLKELMLDLETVTNGALIDVSGTLEILKLDNRVKHIDDNCLTGLNNLKVLDIRDLDFYLLSYPARCSLAHFVSSRLHETDVILSPTENSCECHLLFILTLKRIPHYCKDKNTIEQCALWSACSIVKVYFEELKNIQSYNNDNLLVMNSSSLLQRIKDLEKQENAAVRPAIPGYTPSRHSPVEPVILDIGDGLPISFDTSTKSTGIMWPLPDFTKAQNGHAGVSSTSVVSHVDLLQNEPNAATFNWIPIVVICVVLILSLLLALIIWVITYRRRYKHFKPVASNAAAAVSNNKV